MAKIHGYGEYGITLPKSKLEVRVPHLSLTYDRSYWSLSTRCRDNDNEVSYDLHIRHGWDGETWNQYTFFRIQRDIGDDVQIVDQKEWSDWYDSIVEHQDVDAADEWADSGKVRIFEYPEEEIMEFLIERWEIITEKLRLMEVSINI